MVDPDAVILFESAALIIPERVLVCTIIGQFKRIRQTQIFQFPEFWASASSCQTVSSQQSAGVGMQL